MGANVPSNKKFQHALPCPEGFAAISSYFVSAMLSGNWSALYSHLQKNMCTRT